MKLNVLQIGDDRLLKSSKAIRDFQDKKLQNLIENMIETCHLDREHTAGLAAPQVGENLRLAIIRRIDLDEKIEKKTKIEMKRKIREKSNTSEDSIDTQGEKKKPRINMNEIRSKIRSNIENWEVLINPKINYASEEESTIWEACLSIGTGGSMLMGPVSRPRSIKIEYFDRSGNKKSLEAKGFFSHLIQHEIDHLDGILFINRVPNPERNLWTSEQIDQHIEKFGAYPQIYQPSI